MKTTRRAFLGRAAGTAGIALATPWWVGWVGKYFGPKGHIHDTKVRGYRPVDVAHAHLQYDVEDHDIPGCATTNISSMDALLKEVYAFDMEKVITQADANQLNPVWAHDAGFGAPHVTVTVANPKAMGDVTVIPSCWAAEPIAT